MLITFNPYNQVNNYLNKLNLQPRKFNNNLCSLIHAVTTFLFSSYMLRNNFVSNYFICNSLMYFHYDFQFHELSSPLGIHHSLTSLFLLALKFTKNQKLQHAVLKGFYIAELGNFPLYLTHMLLSNKNKEQYRGKWWMKYVYLLEASVYSYCRVWKGLFFTDLKDSIFFIPSVIMYSGGVFWSSVLWKNALDNFMKINASGSLFVGVGSAANPSLTFLSDPDSGLYSNSANSYGFTTGGVENALIYNTGKWRIGPNNRTKTDATLDVNGTSTTGNAPLDIYRASSTAGAYLLNGVSDVGGGQQRVFTVYCDGDIDTGTGAGIGTISDRRLKTDIQPARNNYLDDLNKLKLCNYKMKGMDRKLLGVMAQDVEQVFPSLVKERHEYGKKPVDDDGNEFNPKSVSTGVLLFPLISAVQELSQNGSFDVKLKDGQVVVVDWSKHHKTVVLSIPFTEIETRKSVWSFPSQLMRHLCPKTRYELNNCAIYPNGGVEFKVSNNDILNKHSIGGCFTYLTE